MDDAAIYDARLQLVDFCIEVFWDAPSDEFVADLLEGSVSVPEDPITDRMDEGFEMLEAWRERNRGRSPESVHEELRREYTHLFVGPRPPVLPHETYYRDDTDFLGEGLAEVSASYAAAGWNPPEDYPEEDDFIAVELAFLRHLIERQRAGDEETVGFERVFIEEHLTQWVDPFLAEMREEADEGLFLAAALVFRGLVTFEDELVAQLA